MVDGANDPADAVTNRFLQLLDDSALSYVPFGVLLYFRSGTGDEADQEEMVSRREARGH